MDEIDVVRSDDIAEPSDPADAAGSVQAVSRDPPVLELFHQGVLPGQQERRSVGEPLAVVVGGCAREQLLGPAATESLDQEQDVARHPATTSRYRSRYRGAIRAIENSSAHRCR